MQGWLCPKCSKVYAPFVQECASCNKINVQPWTNPGTGNPYPQYPIGTPMDTDNEMPCLVQEFFKNNPLEKVAMLSCPCPRCTPRC